MATEGPKSVATFFLFINLLIYAIVVVIAGWALNYGIDETTQAGSCTKNYSVRIPAPIENAPCPMPSSYRAILDTRYLSMNWTVLPSVSGLSLPARLFPIYYPIGNFATGFFVIFSLIAGLVGVASSLTGLQNVLQGNASGLLSAASSSVIAWGLTVLAMGLACKEISIGWRTAGLRALETLTILVSGTQLLCTGAIHAGLTSTINQPHFTGRV